MQPLLGPDTPSSRRVTACPGGTSTSSAAPFEDRRLESVDPGGAQWRRHRPPSGPSAASSIRRPRSRARRHPSTSRATASSLGEPVGRAAPSASQRFGRAADRRPASRRRCGRASATRSGSSSGATSPSTRSARSPAPRSTSIAGDPGTRARRPRDDAGGAGGRRDARRRASRIDVDQRIAGGRRRRRPQDLDAPGPGARPADGDRRPGRRGRRRWAGWSSVPTPTIDTVLALVIQRARVAGCYG